MIFSNFSKRVHGGTGWRIVFLLVALSIFVTPLVALSMLNPEVARAADYNVWRSVASPYFVVNDGTMSVEFRWNITFGSTPDHYTFEIWNSTGGGVFTAPVPGTYMYVNITGDASPVHNPEYPGNHVWTVPLGQKVGQYIARLDFFNTASGEDWWYGGFEVRKKSHLKMDIISPLLSDTLTVGQNLTVTANITNTGQSPATNINATLFWTGNATLVEGANPQFVGNITPNASALATWKLYYTGPGSVTINVNASGTDGTSGSAIPVANIEPASMPLAPVPELPTLVLLGIGLVGLGGWVVLKRRRKSLPQA